MKFTLEKYHVEGILTNQWTRGPGDPGTQTRIGIHCMCTYIVHT